MRLVLILLLTYSSSTFASGFLTVKNSSLDTIKVEEGVFFVTKDKVLSDESISLPIISKINKLKISYKILGSWQPIPNCPQGFYSKSSMKVHVVSRSLQPVCE